MSTHNEPRPGATQQSWWNEQPADRRPPQIPAQRTAGWPETAPAAPVAATAERSGWRGLLRWSGVVVAAVVVLVAGIAIGAGGQQPAPAAPTPAGPGAADLARIAGLEQQLADAQGANRDLQARVDSLTAAPPVPAAPAPPPAPVETGPASSVSDGTYQVGVDVVAGRYKTDGPGSTSIMDSCYLQRSKDDSGEFGSIIANDNVTGPSSVTVKKGEFVTFRGGCTWTRQ